MTIIHIYVFLFKLTSIFYLFYFHISYHHVFMLYMM